MENIYSTHLAHVEHSSCPVVGSGDQPAPPGEVGICVTLIEGRTAVPHSVICGWSIPMFKYLIRIVSSRTNFFSCA